MTFITSLTDADEIGETIEKMENRKRTSPIQDLVFYRQFDKKSNPMSND